MSPSSSALGRERGNRVDNDNINRTGTHDHVRDFQRLLACIGLRHQQVVDINPNFFRILRV